MKEVKREHYKCDVCGKCSYVRFTIEEGDNILAWRYACREHEQKVENETHREAFEEEIRFSWWDIKAVMKWFILDKLKLRPIIIRRKPS